MKKYILALLIVFSGISCSDNFLEEKMVSTITQDYFDTETGLEQLIVGTYNSLRWKYGWMEGPYCFETGHDMAIMSGSYACNTFSPTIWSASGTIATYTNDLMGQYAKQLLGAYPIINNCNRAIESIRSGTAQGKFASDASYASLRLSEALFNRDWSFYMMNTMLGDIYVPTKSSTSLPNSFNYPKMSSEDLYKLMISDLRYCFEHLPTTISSGNRGRLSKYAAAHFLAKLYLQRAQGADYGTAEYGRQSDGSIDTQNEKSYLGMLYKGKVSSDLDSCIYYTTQIIGSGNYTLEANYADLFHSGFDDWSNQDSKEVILQASYGNGTDNGRFGMRFQSYFTCQYNSSLWGIPSETWEYGHLNTGFRTNDWGYDVFTDKMADSRFEKSFKLEYESALCGNTATKGPDLDYYTYDDSRNATIEWNEENSVYFNKYIYPTYNRESWGERKAVAGQHKIGTGDLGLVFLENTKETAIDIKEAEAQPYILYPRWVKDGSKYYYRPIISDKNGFNIKTFNGLENGSNVMPSSTKHIDKNRTSVNSEYGTRDVFMFRLAETYLIRAEAYGRKSDFSNAIKDINVVRARAAYKVGEKRAEVLARLYPGHEKLAISERSYPYNVAADEINNMKVDESYWDGSSTNSITENYPDVANTNQKRFIEFIYNELGREMNSEMTYYEGVHHAGIQAERIQWHHQQGSTLQNHWDKADNLLNGTGQNGNGKGTFKNAYTIKPYPQTFIDQLTDESGKLLDANAKKAYQNNGY